MGSYQQTPRTAVRRLPKRGTFDRATIHAILDEAFVCHIACVIDGTPVVIPTAYGRSEDQLYVHGSAASRMLRAASDGAEVCLVVTLVDGLVMARSAFHHSINYRSVVVFGRARLVSDAGEKVTALRCISDHIAPGRWDEVREPNAKELAATSVIAIPLEEVSAKLRTGPPIDDEEDYALPVWAGVLPMQTRPGVPVNDGRVAEGIAVSPSVARWGRPQT
jgi:nitroimidazol reductase NimA-like FMN-containing flavoprotein (pyridoxamine 5'-phosphate oxidase superfamily)